MKHFLRKFLYALVCVAMISSSGALKTSAGSPNLPEARIFRVSPTGTDVAGCGSEIQPCRSIQYAVNQTVSGDTILVAEGTYTYNNLDPCTSPITHSVVCWWDKQLTINGGYSDDNWTVADPVDNLTIIDGGGTYRGVAILRFAGIASLNMQGFTIQNGRAVGAPVGNQYTGHAFGAGMWVSQSFVNLKNMVFKNNIATGGSSQSYPVAGWGFGGGLALEGPPNGGNSTLEKLLFTGNQSIGGSGSNGAGNGLGGGLFSDHAALTAKELTFTNNLAKGGINGGSGCSNPGSGYGGAAALQSHNSLNLTSIIATGNQALGSNATGTNSCPGTGAGGGFFLEGATASISDSLFQANLATGGMANQGGVGWAGGLYTDKVNLTLDRVRFIGNIATSGGSNGSGAAGAAGGGAAYLAEFDGNTYHTTILNCLFAENKAVRGSPGNNGGGGGAGIFIQGIAADITHSTFVNNKCDNGLCDGQGLLVIKSSRPGSANIKYSIFTDHQNSKTNYNSAVQINPDPGNTGSLSYVWFGNNTSDIMVPAGTLEDHVTSDSRSAGYVSPSSPNYDYHLRSDALVIDLASGSPTNVDLDRLSRPVGLASDPGSYEYRVPTLVPDRPVLFGITDSDDIFWLTDLISVNVGPAAEWTATTSSNWVYLGPSGTSQQTTGQTGTNLTVRFDPSKISLGNYVVTINLTSRTADPTTITIYFYYVDRVEKVFLPDISK
jgi:hypothetical protein